MPPKPRASKKVKTVDSDPAAAFVPAQLSGVLGRLPVETLLDILTLCDPKGVVRFLATCKALQQLATQNESYVFRKLYHSTLALVTRENFHVIHSPARNKTAKKGEVVRFPANKPLPVDAVYSWKLQYQSLVVWNAALPNYALSWPQRPSAERCMDCGVKGTVSELAKVPEWEVRFCLLCFANNLVIKSNISVYRLTENDIHGLPTVEFATESGFGQIIPKPFYCALHLVSLAREKHGAKFEGPRPVADEKEKARQAREDLVSTATLLHSGARWNEPIFCNSGSARNYFVEEFDHFVNAKSFKKGYHLKKRPGAEILDDYVSFVSDSGNIGLRRGVMGIAPQPSPTPGPASPSTSSIAAFTKLREAAQREQVALFPSDGNSSLFATLLTKMQECVLDPVSHAYDLEEIIDDLRSFRNASIVVRRQHTALDLPDWTTRDVSGLVAAVTSEGVSAPSMAQIGRICVLAQIGLIVGTPVRTFDAAWLPLPMSEVHAAREYWRQGFYRRGVTTEVLKHIYTQSMNERKDSLKKIGIRAPTSNHTPSGDNLALHSLLLSPTYNANNTLTAKRLSNRTKVSRSAYEEDIHRSMGLIHAGIVAQSSLCAVLQKFSSGGCGGVVGKRCLIGECFIRMIGRCSYIGLYYDGSDDEGRCDQCGEHH